ncbi:LysM peptidoglycan-binding domain-containing protein [Modestobacter sp. NPDC049651]|uniref:LysM peptidoglycan-binding domain-containing protein n=1 Tax=unclassified Modestobacter TaxID=2643866 RepID=UPI0033FF8907
MATVQHRVQQTATSPADGRTLRPSVVGRPGAGAGRGPQPVGPAGRRGAARPGRRRVGADAVPGGRAVRGGRRPVVAGAPGEWAVGAPAPLRLTRRGRRVLGTLLVVIGLAIAAVAAGMLLGEGDGGLRLAGSATVVVEPGDTLWSIAGDVAPHEERRSVVDAIAGLNHLTGGQVQAGQVLRLP